MAEKGFDIKVLIPTEDGTTIFANEAKNAPYYLWYNVSNRSYQLAGKIKVSELIGNDSFNQKFEDLFTKENIDYIIVSGIHQSFLKPYIKTDYTEINEILNDLIKKIDQKKELI